MGGTEPVDNHDYSAPFEGPEKLLEIWFAPSASDVPGKGLRDVQQHIWEEMLDIVKCQVLSTIHGSEMDAYLLSESSLLISPHKLILKTCGTTLNLLGLPRILAIAREHASLPSVYRCFYSRKSFMFPDRQKGPHTGWDAEVRFLDNIFPDGAGYTVGKVNGDHWLLWLSAPANTAPASPVTPHHALPDRPLPVSHQDGNGEVNGLGHPTALNGGSVGQSSTPGKDYTIEILMSDLAPDARAPFFAPSPCSADYAHKLSEQVGITDIFPPENTVLDAYAFVPCGYSANALLKWKDEEDQGEGYYTIHVTPEEGWSYASFECNVPLAPSGHHMGSDGTPGLRALISRVVNIFRPGHVTLTLFIASEDDVVDPDDASGETAVEAAQRSFKAALVPPKSGKLTGDSAQASYRRTDKINYEFDGYDLAFASFVLCK